MDEKFATASVHFQNKNFLETPFMNSKFDSFQTYPYINKIAFGKKESFSLNMTSRGCLSPLNKLERTKSVSAFFRPKGYCQNYN